MLGDWREITLGDFVALQRGHDLTEPERKPGRIPVVGSAGQNGFHDAALAKGPGIVIGRSGASFGQVHFCPTDYWPHNTGLYVTDFKGNDPRFAFYFLKALDFDRYNSGSAQPSLNRNFIYPIPICIPEPHDQKAIAHILGTLDDKIELNRRMNATLEATARTLFQSWFVDFDPVRAKLDGHKPAGLDAATAELFPDKFQESPLGPIPHGWRACTLGDIANNVSITFDFKRTPEVVFINTGDVLEGDFLHSKRSDHAGLPGQAKKSIRPDDILFSEIRPANKRYAYVDFDSSDYVVSTKFMIIRGSKDIHPRLLYRILTAKETLDEFQVQAESRSGTFPQITFDSINHLPVVLPKLEVQEAFQQTVGIIDARIRVNKQQSRTLAAIRDTLLPKLLSGEISANFPCNKPENQER